MSMIKTYKNDYIRNKLEIDKMKYPRLHFFVLELLGQHDFVVDAKKKINAINHLREKEAKQKYFNEATPPNFYSDVNDKFHDINNYVGPNSLTKKQLENIYHKNIISPASKDGVIWPCPTRLNLSAKAHVRTIDIDVSNMSQEEMMETIEQIRRQRPNISPGPQSAPIRPTGRVVKERKIIPMPPKRPGLRIIKY